MFLVTACNLM